MSEEVLAAQVVSWLRDQDWDVYQEVACGSRADIVALQGPLLWVIECKTSLGISVLEQAYEWKPAAHYVSVATPPTRGAAGFVGRLLRDYGIGWLSVGEGVHERVAPALFRRAATGRIRKTLREEHKTFAAAGSAGGSHWSPWKATCREVQRYVQAHGPCTLKQLIENVPHHYRGSASARAHLAHWIEKGKIPGVRLVRDGKLIRLALDDDARAGR